MKSVAGTGGIKMSVDTDGMVQSLTDIQTDTHWEKPAAAKPTRIRSKHFKNIDWNFSGKKSGRKSSKEINTHFVEKSNNPGANTQLQLVSSELKSSRFETRTKTNESSNLSRQSEGIGGISEWFKRK